jgi:ABC-type bacteriocin/lantibiotic exporter with double-glycine peptidase domain
MNKLLDPYLKRPLVWDAIIVLLVSATFFFVAKKFALNTKDLSSLQSSLAGTAISLAGFILTALTIIVTLRANLSYKGVEKSESGLELIFNSSAYKQIVSIFKGAIQELVLVSLLLYGMMLINHNEVFQAYFLAISTGTLIAITITTLRCLYILFSLVEIEIRSREMASEPMPKPKKWKINIELTSDNKTSVTPTSLPQEFTVEMLEEEVERVFKPY